jgi:predicted enzyme related to lactoylglutathione lyase
MAERTAAPYTPCWTELAVPDPEAAKSFYGAVFGWTAEAGPRSEAGGYTVLKLNGEPVAALAPLSDETQPVAWSVCLSVEDVDSLAAKVEQNGGRVLAPGADVLDLGRYGVLADPAGAAFTVWQPGSFAGSGVIGDPNALGWVELATADPKRALAFYPAVFGWATHLSDSYTEWSVGGVHFGGMADLNQMPDDDGVPRWMPYFRVTDVVDSAERAGGAGATVVVPPADVPGGDVRVSVLKDPQGADFGLFAPAG